MVDVGSNDVSGMWKMRALERDRRHYGRGQRNVGKRMSPPNSRTFGKMGLLVQYVGKLCRAKRGPLTQGFAHFRCAMGGQPRH